MTRTYAVGDRVRVVSRSASIHDEPYQSYILEGRAATVVRVNTVVTDGVPDDEIDIRFDGDDLVLKRFIPAFLEPAKHHA
jgi:hypothetical protein